MHFFDMKPVMMDPECAHLLGVLIHDQIKKIGEVNAVGGLELGAVPLTGITIAKAEKGSSLRGLLLGRNQRAGVEERQETLPG